MTSRPKRNDQAVLELYYKRFAEYLIADDCNFCRGYSIEEIKSGMMKAGFPASDGYDYAKQLEDFGGFDGFTTGDIQSLDEASSVIGEIHDDIVMKWVIDNGIAPKLKDGEACEHKGEAGTVHHEDLYLKIGKYLFRTEQWVTTKGNQGGQILNFEDVERQVEAA
jgi:hypothetical protein